MPHVTVDPTRCHGEQSCVVVCPEEVFAMRPVDRSLPLVSRLVVLMHGGSQAFAARPDACLGCLQCLVACPERAIDVSQWTERAS